MQDGSDSRNSRNKPRSVSQNDKEETKAHKGEMRFIDLFSLFEDLVADLDAGKVISIDSSLLLLIDALRRIDPKELVLPETFLDVMFKLFWQMSDSVPLVRLITGILSLVSNGGSYFLEMMSELKIIDVFEKALQTCGSSVIEDVLKITANFLSCDDHEDLQMGILQFLSFDVLVDLSRYVGSTQAAQMWVQVVKAMVEVVDLDEHATQNLLEIIKPVLEMYHEDSWLCVSYCEVLCELDLNEEMIRRNSLSSLVLRFLESDDERLVCAATRTIVKFTECGMFLHDFSFDVILSMLLRFETEKTYETVLWATATYIFHEPCYSDVMFLGLRMAGLFDRYDDMAYGVRMELVYFLALVIAEAKPHYIDSILRGPYLGIFLGAMDFSVSEKLTQALIAALQNLGQMISVDHERVQFVSELSQSLDNLEMIQSQIDSSAEPDLIRSLITEYPFLFGVD